MADKKDREELREEERPQAQETDQSEESAPDEGQNGPDGEPTTPEEPAKPAELQKLQADYAELSDKYLRLCAEYDNYRKRTARERESIYPEATASVVKGLLGVLDNFERAIAAPCGDPEYKKGAEMTCKSMLDAFGKLGVSAFGEAGDPFDPALHNAVMHVEEEGAETSMVVEVFQKGYRLRDRVLRCAMVKVAN